MTKKSCHLASILILFIIVFFLLTGPKANAYTVGQVVDFYIEQGVSCNISDSYTGCDWNWVPAFCEYKIARSTCAGSPPYGIATFNRKITAAGYGCKVTGCPASLYFDPRECVELKYLFAIEPTPGKAYETVYMRKVTEACKECYQDIEDSGLGGGVKSNEGLVDKNHCAKFKDGYCKVDPGWGPWCPETKCEVSDENGDGDTDDKDDWHRVLATSASTPAGQTARAAASGASNLECACKVQKDGYFWCPPNQKGGCCGPGLKCCSDKPDKYPEWAKCCYLNQTCKYASISGDYCENPDCPDPDRPKQCPGSNYNACCKKDDGCGKKNGVGYCKTCTDPDKPVHCDDDVCCKANEQCLKTHGFWYCSATSCPSDKEPCESTGITKENAPVTICCKPNTCQHDPAGVPYCWPED